MEIELLSEMVSKKHIEIILENLKKSLSIEGEVVELGCNIGTTSIHIQKALKETNKKLYVYDSFQGLPEPTNFDGIIYKKGDCNSTKKQFIENLKNDLPIINEGLFSECEYPNKICFAFFDGDFYSSIMDSFNMVYSKISKGGYILIHDYKFEKLPGVEKACNEFLKDKPEKIIEKDNIGIIKKL